MRALDLHPERHPETVGPTHPVWAKPRPAALPNMLRVAFCAVLLSFTLEGVLRFGLHQIGAEMFLYVRDVFLVLFVVYAFLREVYWKRIGVFGVAILLLAGHGAIGLLQIPNPLQVAFGLKLFLPILAGMAATPLLFPEGRFPVRFLGLLWLLCTVGIALDYFTDLPWTGLTYSVGGKDIEANRLWHTGGVERLSGFTRFSWDAAAQILFTALLLAVAPGRVALKLVMWLITGVVVGLTTTKGMVAAYALCTLALFMGGIFRGALDIRKPVLALSVVACISMPFVATALELPLTGRSNRLLFASLADRIAATWPEAVSQYQSNSPFIGGGIGSIGTPQKYFAADKNPADNFFIYLINLFGLFSFPYVVGLGWKSLALVDGAGNTDRFFSYVALALFSAGVVINVIESPFLALFLGLLIGHLARPKPQPQANR